MSSSLSLKVQIVQAVQIDQAPSFILPRDAGEERGRGLNGAQRLNGLNVLNGCYLWPLSPLIHRHGLLIVAPDDAPVAIGFAADHDRVNFVGLEHANQLI